MKNKDSVELIEYTKAQDALNCVTHALGAIFGAVVLILLIKKAAPFSSARYMASAIVYGLSLILLYGSSAVYHVCRGARRSGQPVSSIIWLSPCCLRARRPSARS